MILLEIFIALIVVTILGWLIIFLLGCIYAVIAGTLSFILKNLI